MNYDRYLEILKNTESMCDMILNNKGRFTPEELKQAKEIKAVNQQRSIQYAKAKPIQEQAKRALRELEASMERR